MKIITSGEIKDRFGTYPACWIKNSKDIQKLQTFLKKEYDGYKFALVFDCTKDEYEDVDEAPVYFLDTILRETAEYIGIEDAVERLRK